MILPRRRLLIAVALLGVLQLSPAATASVARDTVATEPARSDSIDVGEGTPEELREIVHRLVTQSLQQIRKMVAQQFVLSRHPLCSREDCVFDSTLVGKWEGPDSSSIELTRAGRGASHYWMTSDAEPIEAHLVRIGAAGFLDLWPAEADSAAGDHFIFRLQQQGEWLEVGMLNADSCRSLLIREPGAVRHEFDADSLLILTAPSAELRSFIERFDRRPNAFLVQYLKRVRDSSQTSE